MAIEDNKGHSGQGAEGNDPPYQSPAKQDGKDVGQRSESGTDTSHGEASKGQRTSENKETDGRPGDDSGKETKAGQDNR